MLGNLKSPLDVILGAFLLLRSSFDRGLNWPIICIESLKFRVRE